MREPALTKAIACAGGVGPLAEKLGITGPAVSQWERVPAERVLAVEAAVEGKVTRSELRPDLYPPTDQAAD